MWLEIYLQYLYRRLPKFWEAQVWGRSNNRTILACRALYFILLLVFLLTLEYWMLNALKLWISNEEFWCYVAKYRIRIHDLLMCVWLAVFLWKLYERWTLNHDDAFWMNASDALDCMMPYLKARNLWRSAHATKMLELDSIDNESEEFPPPYDGHDFSNSTTADDHMSRRDSSFLSSTTDDGDEPLQVKSETAIEDSPMQDPSVSVSSASYSNETSNQRVESFKNIQEALIRAVSRKSEREQDLSCYKGDLMDEKDKTRDAVRQYLELSNDGENNDTTESIETECSTCRQQTEIPNAYKDLDQLQKNLASLESCDEDEQTRILSELERIATSADTVADDREKHVKKCLEAATKRRQVAYSKLILKRGGVRTIARPKVGEPCQDIIFDSKDNLVCFPNKSASSKQFNFDRVLPPAYSNSQLWSQEIQPLVDSLFSSLDVNVTILVSGQTGSGKTYTMCEREDSLVQSVIRRVFEHKDQFLKTRANLEVSVSAVEVYLGRAYNVCSVQKEMIWFGKDAGKALYMPYKDKELVENTPTHTVQDCQEIFARAVKQREIRNMADFDDNCQQRNNQSKTKLYIRNTQSSRSHLVFTLHLSIENKNVCIQLADLAGKEELIPPQPKMRSHKQDRLQDDRATAREEGKAINQSVDELINFLHDWTGYEHKNIQGKEMIVRALQRGIHGDTPLIAYIATMYTQDEESSSRTCRAAKKLLERKKTRYASVRGKSTLGANSTGR